MRSILKLLIGLATFFFFESLALAQTVTIQYNKSVQYQIMDGFGVSGFRTRNDVFGVVTYNTDFARTIVGLLGVNIYAMDLDPSLEQINDNNDPDSLSFERLLTIGGVATADTAGGCINKECIAVRVEGLPGFQTYALPTGASPNCNGMFRPGDILDFTRMLYTQRLQFDDTLLIYGRITSPPAWMKYTNCISGSDTAWNRLIMDDFLSPNYDNTRTWSIPTPVGQRNADNIAPLDRKLEFAEFLHLYQKIVISTVGATFYALNVAYKPSIADPGPSCVYNNLQLERLFSKINTSKLGVPLAFGDDPVTLDNQNNRFHTWIVSHNAYQKTPVMVSQIPKNNGIFYVPADTIRWNSIYNDIQRLGNRKHWVTGFGNYKSNMNGGLTFAQDVYDVLEYGKANAIIWDNVSGQFDISPQGNEVNPYLLNVSSTSTGIRFSKSGHVFAMLARYISKGARRIHTTKDVGGIIKTLAFEIPQKKQLVFILINTDTTQSVSVTLQNSQATGTPVYYSAYQTSDFFGNDQIASGTFTGADFPYLLNQKGVAVIIGHESIPNTSIKTLQLTEIHTPLYEKYPLFSVPGLHELQVEYFPSHSTDRQVLWQVAPQNIATISGLGVLKPLRPGVVTVTASLVSDSSVFAQQLYTITGEFIYPKLYDFSLSAKNDPVIYDTLQYIDNNYSIVSQFEPEDATVLDETYIANPEGIVVVDFKQVIPLTEGVFTLTGFVQGAIPITKSKLYYSKGLRTISATQRSNNNTNVLFYPNPTRKVLYFTNSNPGMVSIFHTTGQEVMSQWIEPKASIQLLGFSSGMYVVKFGNQVHPLLVE